MEQKHIYKFESIVVLQLNGSARVRTVNTTCCKQEHNLMTQDSLRAGSLVGRVSLAKELREEWGEWE